MNWEKTGGLIPAIIQDAQSAKVLMLGYMNAESLQKTQDSGLVTFYSRSRQCFWTKGESSGNVLKWVDINVDCDKDALLIRVNPQGPVCHRKTETCFEAPFEFLSELEEIIQERLTHKNPGSYVAKLADEGLDRIAQKLGEEAVETVIAAKNPDIFAFQNEAADLLFHFMVLLKYKGQSLAQILDILKQRH